MIDRRAAMALFGAAALSACSKFKSYNGPQVTRVTVHKARRQMYLWHGDKVLRYYDVALGFAPTGHKSRRGDGRTPEGHYVIDRRNPDSRYHLSIGISYPGPADMQFAAANGHDPGGDIFIHGRPKGVMNLLPDWTYGCIAVSNREIEEVYAMVELGTPISIYP